MKLIEPSVAFFESYQSALREFELHGISGFWRFFGPTDDAVRYIQTIRQYEHVTGPKERPVPASVFWLIDDEEFIGHLSIRHSLNTTLEREGGHIGYAIRPSKQRQGYGSKILMLALRRARQLGIQRAIVTCDTINAASRKIIEKNGGTLTAEIEVDGKPVLRFSIML